MTVFDPRRLLISCSKTNGSIYRIGNRENDIIYSHMTKNLRPSSWSYQLFISVGYASYLIVMNQMNLPRFHPNMQTSCALITKKTAAEGRPRPRTTKDKSDKWNKKRKTAGSEILQPTKGIDWFLLKSSAEVSFRCGQKQQTYAP